MNNAPCLNCPDRAIGCHGKCDRYAAFDATRRMTRQARDEGALYEGKHLCQYLARKARQKSRRLYA